LHLVSVQPLTHREIKVDENKVLFTLIGAFVLLSLDENPRIRTWIKQARMHNEL
jgi:hypothetical protein